MKIPLMRSDLRRTLSSAAYVLGRACPSLHKSSIWRATIQVRWEDIEYFDAMWQKRVEQMAAHIPVNAAVMDLGCGRGRLSEIIGSARYTGVDYRPRGEGTIICDFNKRQFPDLRRNVAFVSGCLEYVTDYRWFIEQICDKTEMCILSYCLLETHSNLAARRRAGWVNDLTTDEIRQEFDKHQFKLSAEAVTSTQNAILVFKHIGVDLR